MFILYLFLTYPFSLNLASFIICGKEVVWRPITTCYIKLSFCHPERKGSGKILAE
jgi:hypothetical protein